MTVGQYPAGQHAELRLHLADRRQQMAVFIDFGDHVGRDDHAAVDVDRASLS
jgi:hypothetical protein